MAERAERVKLVHKETRVQWNEGFQRANCLSYCRCAFKVIEKLVPRASKGERVKLVHKATKVPWNDEFQIASCLSYYQCAFKVIKELM